MKKLLKFSVLLLVAMGLMLSLIGCPDPNDDKEKEKGSGGVSFDNEASGTLTVINNVAKDMVLFQGQTPSANNILGGVRGQKEKTFDISDDVNDFSVGGYMIIRGITLDEYNANKTTLSSAKIEYSAMATYKQGQKFRIEISPSYVGDYGYKVNNLGRIGMELRKGSPEGEKIGYLPALATNQILYAETSNAFAIFPVYVYYSKSSGQLTTLKPTSHFDSVTATPRPLNNATSMQTYDFPNDPTVTWQSIVGSLASPVAYFTVTNNCSQGVYFTIAGGNSLLAQNGYDATGTGEQLTYEIESTVDGTAKNLVLRYYSGALMFPVRFAGETTNPVIKNGYDYNITFNFNGGSIQDASNYTVTLTESANKRDISNEIESL